MVDTKKATRRLLRFETIDDVLADIDQLVAAAHAGTLQQLGNWKPGQVFAHVAAWIEYGYDGYPMKTSWFIRMLLRMMLPGLLKNGLKPGAKIPGPRRHDWPRRSTDRRSGPASEEGLSASEERRALSLRQPRIWRDEPRRSDSFEPAPRRAPYELSEALAGDAANEMRAAEQVSRKSMFFKHLQRSVSALGQLAKQGFFGTIWASSSRLFWPCSRVRKRTRFVCSINGKISLWLITTMTERRRHQPVMKMQRGWSCCQSKMNSGRAI